MSEKANESDHILKESKSVSDSGDESSGDEDAKEEKEDSAAGHHMLDMETDNSSMTSSDSELETDSETKVGEKPIMTEVMRESELSSDTLEKAKTIKPEIMEESVEKIAKAIKVAAEVADDVAGQKIEDAVQSFLQTPEANVSVEIVKVDAHTDKQSSSDSETEALVK